MQRYHTTRIVERDGLDGLSLPGEVRLGLEDLAGSVREGLLALSVGVGLKVMEELLEEELVALVGRRGKHDPGRTASRHGSRRGQVVLGGRKLGVRRPRARTVDGRELPLRTYAHFACDDLLSERTVETMLAGLSTRRHRAALEPTGTVDRSVSKSAVSRRFVARTRKALAELLARPVPDEVLVLMLDGVVLAGHTCLCALGIRADGTKVPLGLWEGASENGAVCRRALADLGERGLSAEQELLVVIDGSKALRKAVSDALGAKAAIQRCRRHKQENVLAHLPEAERPWVRRKLREAWALERADLAERRLIELARALEPKRPGAAARSPRRIQSSRCSRSAGSGPATSSAGAAGR
jgi:putative transposase